ncbi:hypothetical protein AB1K70_19415 [Bremerella sp. JC770]|uniref:hypothetical protein n=1 Tax=Bremerella sp. JC770 TaxID=3232137 RepID=UPI003457D602
MTDSDQQRLAELKALTRATQAGPPSAVPFSNMLSPRPERFSASDLPEETDEMSASESLASETAPQAQERDQAHPDVVHSQSLPDLTTALEPGTRRSPRPADVARRVEQSATSTIQLRDQREFKLSLEEDTSRDDALVDRLVEQTVTIVQQRDEALYQRVMQAIEQRLAQARSAFS